MNRLQYIDSRGGGGGGGEFRLTVKDTLGLNSFLLLV